MNKILDVYIAKADEPESEAYANLSLPATPFAIFDALDKARVQQGDELYFQVEDYHAFASLGPFIARTKNLAALNALCQKLSELSDQQSTAFEGLVKMEAEKKNGPIFVRTLINLAHSADCCHVVSGVLNDEQLGRFYAENGFVPDVDDISDRLFGLLDFGRIGRELRQGEGGVFTERGYVTQHSDLKQVYKDMTFRIRTPMYQILLDASKGHFNDPDYDSERSVRIQLPADEAALDAVLTALDVASWDEVGYHCVDCRVPSLMDAITDAEDISAVNDFAELLQGMGDKQMRKYKAILHATGCTALEEAVELAGHMDDFIFEEKICGLRDLAMNELQFMTSDEDAALLAKHTDLTGYGKALLERDHCVISQYGLVERQDGQPINAPLEQQQKGMTMQ